MYDYNEARDYILKESYAKNVRDKIGNAFKEIPISIKTNTEAIWSESKGQFKEDIVKELAGNGELAAEVNIARGIYNTLNDRLEAILNNAAPV